MIKNKIKEFFPFLKRVMVLVIFFCLFILIPLKAKALTDRGAFTISSFDVDIDLQQNGSFLVNEKIEVNFSQPRHGIFRNIPVEYVDDKGLRYNLRLDVVSVQDGAGKNRNYSKRKDGEDIVLKIEDSKKEVVGNQIYNIKYRIRRGIRFFDEHVEMYWNPIGTEWNTRIKNADVNIRFHEKIRLSEEDAVCFVGEKGSKNEDRCHIQIYSSGEAVSFLALTELRPKEGLTVAIKFSKNFIVKPSLKEESFFMLIDNWGILMPIPVFIFMFIFWLLKGKEINLKKAVIAQFKAPNNLTPGEMGYLMKERYVPSFISAEIVNLAVKGYLRIEEVEKITLAGNLKKASSVITLIVSLVFFFFILIPLIKSFRLAYGIDSIFIGPFIILFGFFVIRAIRSTFKKSGNDGVFDYKLIKLKEWKEDQSLKSHEKRLLKGIFNRTSNNKEIGLAKLSDSEKLKRITEFHDKTKSKLMRRIVAHFKRNMENKLAVKSSGGDKETVEGGVNNENSVKISDLTDFYKDVKQVNEKLKDQIKNLDYFEKKADKNKTITIIVGVLFLVMVVFIAGSYQRIDFLIGGILSGVMIIFFGNYMTKKTLNGAEAYNHALGFRRYINTAERYRVEFQLNNKLFEEVFPYAMIFGLAKKWSKAFEGIYTNNPSWYSSKTSRSFDPVHFSDSMSTFSSLAQSASTPPRSSSSSGFSGGSSGGGGGGGGGGSW